MAGFTEKAMTDTGFTKSKECYPFMQFSTIAVKNELKETIGPSSSTTGSCSSTIANDVQTKQQPMAKQEESDDLQIYDLISDSDNVFSGMIISDETT